MLTALGCVLTLPGMPATAQEQSVTPTTLALSGPTRVLYATPAALVATLRTADGSALAGQPVALERLSGTTWRPAGMATTATDGTARWRPVITPDSGTSRFRARYAGSAADPATPEDGGYAPALSTVHAVSGFRLGGKLRLAGRHRVRDGARIRLRVRWVASGGRAVPGVVRVERAVRHGSWQPARTRRLDTDGRLTLRVRPRVDTRWRVVGLKGPWWLGARSAVHRIDNRPPGRPVRYPAAAPRPAPLPTQPRATGRGANLRIGTLPDAVWRSMVGRSWHPGCPVGRAGLRLIRVNYWDFEGYRRRGELVTSAAIARRAGAALVDMYRGRFPIRAMYRVDRFGWSARSHGADDFASMRHDNTSAFNCRWVTGTPGRTSPHSSGRAVDVNPFENPYWSRVGPLPNRWWTRHSDPRIAWRSRSHPVARIWLRHGFRWTYANADSQHFDGRLPAAPEGGFVA